MNVMSRTLICQSNSTNKVSEIEKHLLDICFLSFRCIRETVRGNMELILDELETDIIEDTLNLSNASEFIKESVVHINRPRQSRAKRFVMYMMQNESVLKNFITVFKKKSFVDLIPAECESCSIKDRDSKNLYIVILKAML